MSVIRLIGDVHGKNKRYREVIRGCPRSIQLGDMGIGFLHYGGDRHGQFQQNPPFDAMAEGNHRFIRGNHDAPIACRKHKFWIPDGTVEDDIMFIGGAVSIDREFRIKGYSWWEDEEPSIPELLTMVDVYKMIKPKIMVTHEVPESVAKVMCEASGSPKFNDGSRCRQAFQSMFEIHQPQLWLGGHWHRSFNRIINGTRFIILNELEWIDLDTDTLEIVSRGQG